MWSWKKLFFISILTTYIYVFMEWLFFVTMPSFMGGMSFIAKIRIVFVSGGAVALLFLIPTLVLALLYLLFTRFRFSRLFFLGAAFFPAFVLGILVLILVDNFTYTVFHFGIINTAGIWRGAYAAFFLLLLFVTMRWTLRFVRPAVVARLSQNRLLILSASLIVISAIFAVIQYNPSLAQDSSPSISLTNLPNILLIGSDGVNADNMSLYGYERDTTPFLQQIAPSFLIAENAFTNSSQSYMSVLSILTGRNPTQVGIYSNNDILTGSDAFEHLPGILRKAGYYNIQFGVTQYIDASLVNMQDGFDVINQRFSENNPIYRLFQNIGWEDSAYFLMRITERVSDRLMHIFYVKVMVNAYEQATEPDSQFIMTDQEKIDQMLDLITTTDTPLFVHIHLVGTHGSKFYPTVRKFSEGEEQNEHWMIDYYDDSILTFDSYVKYIYDTLANSDKLNNTLLVIYTDHNMMHRSDQRIPLLFYFPGGEFAGVIKNNVQNVDIAPTILDYLGISKPDWMIGQSLLDGEPPRNRLIFSGDEINDIRIVQCQRWYRFNAQDSVWFTGIIDHQTAPCGDGDVLNADDIPPEILLYLAEKGFEIQYQPSIEIDYANYAKFIYRRQVAISLLQAKYGEDYVPPPATGIFVDVPTSDPDAGWIEQVYREGIVDSCNSSPLAYCPDQEVTRADIAVFLLKAVEGRDYVPASARGIFEDVSPSSPFAPWIEEIYSRGITAGCSRVPLLYCPTDQLIGEGLIAFIDRASFNQSRIPP